MTIEINGAACTLLHEKALYKIDDRLLVIADIHLGKASHFRKEGIPIPAAAQMADYEQLRALLEKVAPEKVYFLGDLFHSTFNRDWHYFSDLIALFPQIKFTLVKGNHDIIDEKLFAGLHIDIVDEAEDDHFLYVHEPVDEVPEGKVAICGHIHPGIVLSGMGRQSLKVPCYYMHARQLILPAFGVLTGLYGLARHRDAEVYIVVQDKVMAL